jgi:hypothetical protein
MSQDATILPSTHKRQDFVVIRRDDRLSLRRVVADIAMSEIVQGLAADGI